MWDEVREEVEVDLEQLGELLASFREFWDKPHTWRPSLVELAAIASVLHSFYNGAENILRRISIRVDGGLPSGEAWHTELLASMAGPTSRRGPVITAETHVALLDYLRFRHFVRSSYVFRVRWELAQPLVANCRGTLTALAAEVRHFLDDLPPQPRPATA